MTACRLQLVILKSFRTARSQPEVIDQFWLFTENKEAGVWRTLSRRPAYGQSSRFPSSEIRPYKIRPLCRCSRISHTSRYLCSDDGEPRSNWKVLWQQKIESWDIYVVGMERWDLRRGWRSGRCQSNVLKFKNALSRNRNRIEECTGP